MHHSTGFVWSGKVRMKTAIFDLVREKPGNVREIFLGWGNSLNGQGFFLLMKLFLLLLNFDDFLIF